MIFMFRQTKLSLLHHACCSHVCVCVCVCVRRACDWCFLPVIHVICGITFTCAWFPADICFRRVFDWRSHSPVIVQVWYYCHFTSALSFSTGCIWFTALALFDKGLFNIFYSPSQWNIFSFFLCIFCLHIMVQVSCIFELRCVCVFLNCSKSVFENILTSKVGGCKNRNEVSVKKRCIASQHTSASVDSFVY